jgi:hypothetical protein
MTMAQQLLRKAAEDVQDRIKEATSPFAKKIKDEVMHELHLDTMAARYKRITGNNLDLDYEDDSEMGILIRDKVLEIGLVKLRDKIKEAYQTAGISVDQAADAAAVYIEIGKFRVWANSKIDEWLATQS